MNASVSTAVDLAGTRALTEANLARVAIGLVALHVVDDNWLQPEPGMSAGDHLVSGLVPLAQLALAGFGYARLRAGWRATVALLVGAFGIAAGVEAVYYTVSGGPSGDDFTGWLSLASGIVLLGVCFVTLWRTRRTDDSLRRRYLRRALIVVAALIVATQVLLPLVIARS